MPGMNCGSSQRCIATIALPGSTVPKNTISLNCPSLKLTASLESCGSTDHPQLQPDGHSRAARATHSSPVPGEQKLMHQRSPQTEALDGRMPSSHSYPEAFLTWPCICLLTNWTAFESFHLFHVPQELYKYAPLSSDAFPLGHWKWR